MIPYKLRHVRGLYSLKETLNHMFNQMYQSRQFYCRAFSARGNLAQKGQGPTADTATE